MRPIVIVACAAAASVAAAFVAGPAVAAPKRTAHVQQPSRYIYYGRAPARVVVRKRSFLDPGREPLPYSQHYNDYADELAYRSFPKYFDYSVPGSFTRMPYPSRFDAPGMPEP